MSSKPYLENPSKHAPSKSSTSLTESAGTDRTNEKEERMFRRLRKLLPPTPYLLTLPPRSILNVDRAYPDQANNWTERTPFTREEGELQYVSFIPRDNSNSVMLSRGAWEEERMDTSKISRDRSGTNTPVNGQIKKKITLSAYKNKQTSGYLSGTANDTPTHSAPEDSVKAAGPVKREKKSVEGRSEESTKSTYAMEKGKSRPVEKLNRVSHTENSTKRSIDNVNSNSSRRLDDDDSPPPKKARLGTLQPGSQQHHVEETPKITLPPMLSPTLPPVIERKLAKIEKDRDGSSPLSSARDVSPSDPDLINLSSSTRSILERPEKRRSSISSGNLSSLSARDIRAAKRKRSGDEGESSALSDISSKKAKQSQNSKRTVEATKKAPKTPGFFDSLRGKSYKAEKTSQKPARSESTKPLLVVKLKYGKKNKKSIERILKISARLKSGTTTSAHEHKSHDKNISSDKETASKADTHSKPSKTPHTSADMTGHNRPRSSTNDHSITGGKIRPGESTRPHTPLTNQSPPLSNSNSTHKSHLATPRSSMATALRASGNDNAARTPSSFRSAGSPGLKSNGASQEPPSNDIKAWIAESNRLKELGRSLKHEAERTLQTKAQPPVIVDEETRRRGTIVFIESMLCYVLAFTAYDRTRSSGSSSKTYVREWESILGFAGAVLRSTQPYPHLQGLMYQLIAICHEAIQVHSENPRDTDVLLERLTDKNTEDVRAVEKTLRRTLKNPAEARHAWQEGNRLLGVDELESRFPRSWSRRRMQQADEQIEPGDYTGYFSLPLGGISMPTEAVRFGLSALQEWADKKSVTWNPKLKLSRSA